MLEAVGALQSLIELSSALKRLIEVRFVLFSFTVECILLLSG